MGSTLCRADYVSFRHCFSYLAATAILISISGKSTAQAAPMPPDFTKGALYGAVIDTATGKPIPDATVAVVTPEGKVLAWTKTGADGKYAIAADTYTVLHLRPSHRRGLLEEVCRGVGNVAMAPVKVAVGAVSRPGETVKAAVESTILGNPAPIATQVTNSLTNRAKSTPNKAELSARQATVNEVFSERHSVKRSTKPGLCPGELSIAVSAPGYKDLKGAAGAYWMEPAVDDKAKPKLGVQAWMETVKMAVVAAPVVKKSEVAKEALLLAEPTAVPALAPSGSSVHLTVKLKNPVGFGPKVRIFAREKKKDTTVELLAGDAKTPDLYSGDLLLDTALPSGVTQIAIGVLRTEPLEVKIPKAKEDPLLRFAGRIEEMEAGKPFEFDPRIFACENRMDLTITVLDSKHVTAPSGGTPVPSPPGTKPPAAGAAPVPAPPAATPPVAAPPVPAPPAAKPPAAAPPVPPPPAAKPPVAAPPVPVPPAAKPPVAAPPDPVPAGGKPPSAGGHIL